MKTNGYCQRFYWWGTTTFTKPFSGMIGLVSTHREGSQPWVEEGRVIKAGSDQSNPALHTVLPPPMSSWDRS